MKHTKGPWGLVQDNTHIRSVATVHWCGSTEDENYYYDIIGAEIPETPMERKANAILMAAAPELLNALADLVRLITHPSLDHDETIPEIVTAQKAVEKAGGHI